MAFDSRDTATPPLRAPSQVSVRPIPGVIVGPLLADLQAENERLRREIDDRSEELAALRSAHAELAQSLRLLAPLRRVQERVRLAAQDVIDRRSSRRIGPARRDARLPESAESEGVWGPTGGMVNRPSPSSGTNRAKQSSPDAATAAKAWRMSGHPLLARTARWIDGEPLLPQPDLRPIRTGCAGRVLVIAHVYYPDLWPGLAKRITRIPGEVDLVVTLSEGRAEALAEAIVAQFPQATVAPVANRGRDLWPLVRVVQLGLIGDHDAILKLHTKASVHRLDGDRWRDQLLDSLCPSPDRVGLMLELLASRSDVGMIAPAGAALGHLFWGANGPMVKALALRSGVEVDPRRVRFPGGSMFWCRPEPLIRLRDAALAVEDFEHETLRIDGTTAHALERFLGALVLDCGMRVIAADQVAGEVAAERVRTPQAILRSPDKARRG